MLILRRKPGETFLIGNEIKITVLSSDLNGTRLAIEAPKEVPILRSELLGAMDANREAANVPSQPQALLAMLTRLKDAGEET
ncbi:MAG: carbon storage regulator [Lawsonibacter sp.]